MIKLAWNEGWYFANKYQEKFKSDSNITTNIQQKVRLPHTVKEVPFNQFDENEYQMLSSYTKIFKLDKSYKDKRIFVTFDGVAHSSTVYCNGKKVGSHHCGYTGFKVELTSYLSFENENNLTIVVDSHENLDIPPFGKLVDYMTFGGIYREVWLEIKNDSYIKDVFVKADMSGKIECECEIESKKAYTLKACIYNKTGEKCVEVTDNKHPVLQIKNPNLWSPENPYLYEIKIELYQDNELKDVFSTKFGVRSVEFSQDGFYLNGKRYQIRGLNRHQSYPYIGYAAPERAQKLDADILKYELGCNTVRTSHYPQSHNFINRCDEIGLLVFTEIPGWQHIGGDKWKKQAIQNVKDMVTQYRNHPSIFIWGVRINESKDDDKFYKACNKAAKELDKTRPTSGVRAHGKSPLFDDVYSYNDFVYSGYNKGCENKQSITSDMKKGYLVTEYNGHMYPTKAYDSERHRTEHAMRHARVLNAIASNKDIAGSLAWCMFDYNTHKDFGSGDEICYHGVMDMFRNKKLAASVYASQSDENVVLEVCNSMDIGEHPESSYGDVITFTNADYVNLYKNDEFVAKYTPSDEFSALKHPPIVSADLIGELLEKNEQYDKKTCKTIKKILLSVSKYGLYAIPLKVKLMGARLVLMKKATYSEALALYGKYLATWGGVSFKWKFEAVKDGKVVATKIKCANKVPKLKVDIDSCELVEKNTWDMATVRIKAVDGGDNVLTYCNRSLQFEVEGDIELIGPKFVPLSGGMCGCYIKSIGKSGTGTLRIKMQGVDDFVQEFTVKTEK